MMLYEWPPVILSRQFDKGYIIPGKHADITVFDENFKIKMVIVQGIVKRNYIY